MIFTAKKTRKKTLKTGFFLVLVFFCFLFIKKPEKNHPKKTGCNTRPSVAILRSAVLFNQSWLESNSATTTISKYSLSKSWPNKNLKLVQISNNSQKINKYTENYSNLFRCLHKILLFFIIKRASSILNYTTAVHRTLQSCKLSCCQHHGIYI